MRRQGVTDFPAFSVSRRIRRGVCAAACLFVGACGGGPERDPNDPYARYLRLLKQVGPGAGPEAIPLVRSALSDPSPLVREGGLIALLKLNRPDLAGEAEPLLNDPDPRVREAAAKVIHEYRLSTAVGALLKRLETDPEPVVRRAAVKALAPLARQPLVVPALVSALRDEDPSVRLEAYVALRESTGRSFPRDDIDRWEEWVRTGK